MFVEEARSLLTPQVVQAALQSRDSEDQAIHAIELNGPFTSSAASVYRMMLTSREASDGREVTRSLFVKIYEGDRVRSFAMTEIAFLSEIAPKVAIAPKLLGIVRPSEEIVILLLEDLTDAYTNDASVLSAHLPQLAEDLGRFHSAHWDSRLLGREVFGDLRPVQTRMHFASPKAIEENESFIKPLLTKFRATYRSELNEAENEILDLMGAHWGELFLGRVHSRNLTLIHGDFHLLGNIFYSERLGRFRVIDWADAKIGLGAHDLAYCLGPVASEDRVARDTKLMKVYLGSLIANGVGGYNWENLQFDYRLALLNNLFQSVSQNSFRWFRNTHEIAHAWKAESLLR